MDGELSAWLGKGNSAASQASRNGEITLWRKMQVTMRVIIGNFRFATATKSSTTTRFFSSIFLQSETFFHLFIYKHIFLTMVESKHAQL